VRWEKGGQTVIMILKLHMTDLLVWCVGESIRLPLCSPIKRIRFSIKEFLPALGCGGFYLVLILLLDEWVFLTEATISK
jgi:hypothetical protein